MWFKFNVNEKDKFSQKTYCCAKQLALKCLKWASWINWSTITWNLFYVFKSKKRLYCGKKTWKHKSKKKYFVLFYFKQKKINTEKLIFRLSYFQDKALKCQSVNLLFEISFIRSLIFTPFGFNISEKYRH